MNMHTVGNLLSISLNDPRVLFGRKNYIFLLSHMRSYSTVLSHILGSHSEVSGYSELQQSYFGVRDLLRARYKVYLANDNSLDGRFVLDKILHNRCVISESILKNASIFAIFMLRNPEDTIRSIINVGINLVSIEDWYQDPEKVLSYYACRLEQIALYSSMIRGRAVFLRSEQVINSTELTLEFLADQLEFSQKIDACYKIFKQTGLPGKGDTSNLIYEGKINRQRKDYSNIHIPAEILEQAQSVYDSCLNILRKRCISI